MTLYLHIACTVDRLACCSPATPGLRRCRHRWVAWLLRRHTHAHCRPRTRTYTPTDVHINGHTRTRTLTYTHTDIHSHGRLRTVTYRRSRTLTYTLKLTDVHAYWRSRSQKYTHSPTHFQHSQKLLPHCLISRFMRLTMLSCDLFLSFETLFVIKCCYLLSIVVPYFIPAIFDNTKRWATGDNITCD